MVDRIKFLSGQLQHKHKEGALVLYSDYEALEDKLNQEEFFSKKVKQKCDALEAELEEANQDKRDYLAIIAELRVTEAENLKLREALEKVQRAMSHEPASEGRDFTLDISKQALKAHSGQDSGQDGD